MQGGIGIDGKFPLNTLSFSAAGDNSIVAKKDRNCEYIPSINCEECSWR
jgi:hypothetical protein